MARITVEDCIDKFESRFELVLVASNRARKLHSGENPTVEKDNDKPTVIALREIADETVTIESLKSKLIEEYQIVSPLDEEDLSLDYSGSENQLEEEVNIYKGDFDQKIEEVDLSADASTEDSVNDTQASDNADHPDGSDENNPEIL